MNVLVFVSYAPWGNRGQREKNNAFAQLLCDSGCKLTKKNQDGSGTGTGNQSRQNPFPEPVEPFSGVGCGYALPASTPQKTLLGPCPLSSLGSCRPFLSGFGYKAFAALLFACTCACISH